MTPSDPLVQRYAHPAYTLRRRAFKLGARSYLFKDPEGNPVFTSQVRSRAFRMSKEIRLYTTAPPKRQLALRVRTGSFFGISGTYQVTDEATQQPIGGFQRNALEALLLAEWNIFDASGEPCGKLVCDTLKNVRRGRLATRKPFQKFEYHAIVQGDCVAKYAHRHYPFYDSTHIDLSPDTQHRLDPRLGLTAAVLLAGIEFRNN